MNIQSEKGAFAVIFVLMTAFFVGVLLLGFHKNISSFIGMEQKAKKTLSQNKIKQVVLNSLQNYTACSNTFSKTEEFVTSIKNLYNRKVFDFSISNVDFYKESGFHEKTGFRIIKMKIKKDNPKNFEIPRPGSPIAMESYEYPPGTGIRHSIATLRTVFSKTVRPASSDEKINLYAPIYIREEYGNLNTCSTSAVARNKMKCAEQSVRVICCRYIYNLTLDPDDFYPEQDFFSVRKRPYTVSASPGEPEQVDIVKTTEDPMGVNIAEECAEESNVAQLKGFCTYSVNWVLEASCE